MSTFPCTSCGACCRRAPSTHPDWPKRADGACVHLKQDNTCAIYEVRPLICRVDDMRPKAVPIEEWHYANAVACNKAQVEDGLPENLRVLVPETDTKNYEESLPELGRVGAEILENMSKND